MTASVDFVASLAGAAVVLAVPGPTNALLTAVGAEHRRGAAALIGAVVVGYAAAIAGLRLVGGPLIEALPAASALMRVLLAGWLVFLGCCLWRRLPSGASRDVGPREVLVATLLNPKSAVFAFVLWPQGAGAAEIAAWGAGVAALIAAVSFAWVETGRRLGRLGARQGLAVARIAAAVLFVFALVLGAGALTALV